MQRFQRLLNQVQRFQRLSARIGYKRELSVAVTAQFARAPAEKKITSKFSSLLELLEKKSNTDVVGVTLQLPSKWKLVFSHCVGKGSFGVAWSGTLSFYRDGSFLHPVDVVIKRQTKQHGGHRTAYRGEWAKEYTIAAYIADSIAPARSKFVHAHMILFDCIL